MTVVLLGRGRATLTQREDSHVKTEMVIVVVLPQVHSHHAWSFSGRLYFGIKTGENGSISVGVKPIPRLVRAFSPAFSFFSPRYKCPLHDSLVPSFPRLIMHTVELGSSLSTLVT